MSETPAKLEDQPDTLAMIEKAFGGARDILMNGTTMRYLSDHIEELIAARVAVAWQASRQQALEDEKAARLKAWETAWDACRKQTVEECARACISGDADDCAAAIRSLTFPRNQCDGCARGLPINSLGIHKNGDEAVMTCTADRYATIGDKA